MIRNCLLVIALVIASYVSAIGQTTKPVSHIPAISIDNFCDNRGAYAKSSKTITVLRVLYNDYDNNGKMLRDDDNGDWHLDLQGKFFNFMGCDTKLFLSVWKATGWNNFPNLSSGFLDITMYYDSKQEGWFIKAIKRHSD